MTVTVHHSNTSLSTPPASRPADGRRLHHPPQDVHHWGPQQTLRDVCLLRCSLNACTQYAHQHGPGFTCQPTTTAMTMKSGNSCLSKQEASLLPLPEGFLGPDVMLMSSRSNRSPSRLPPVESHCRVSHVYWSALLIGEGIPGKVNRQIS